MNRWTPGDVEIANWQFWLLLFLVPSTLVAVIRYLSFRVRYDDTELVIRTGVLFRNERHIPYHRIQNLDAVRNVVHRLLGVSQVRIETGGGNTPEATISVLHDTVVEEMRRRVFAGRSGADPGSDAVAPGHDHAPVAAASRTLLHLPLRELLLNGVLENRGMILVGAAYGVLWEAGLLRVVWDRMAGGWYRPGLIRETARGLAAGDLPAVGQVAVAAAGLVALLALVRLISMAWSGLRLYDFRLALAGRDLRTEYGLLTRVTATIPLDRVQTLTIREAPLQRLLKRLSIRVDTAGASAGPDKRRERSREWLAPIVRRVAMPALVHNVLPDLNLDALEWQPLHPRAFQRTVKPTALISLAATIPAVSVAGWWGFAVTPIALAWLLFVAWHQVRRMAWALTSDVVAFRSGWLWRHLTVAPLARIQAVDRVESPFDRRAGMASVRVDTAGAGELAHRIAIPYLAQDTAQGLYQRLAGHAARTTLRW